MGKKILTVLGCLAASIAIVVFMPMVLDSFTGVQLTKDEETTIGMFHQSVVEVKEKASLVHKIYADGKLVGILNSDKQLKNHLENVYKERFEKEYPNSEAYLGRNVYMTDEMSYYIYSDADDQIFQYLDDNDLYSLKATEISFSENNQVTAKMYVLDPDMYVDAMQDFVSLFIDPESLAALNNGDTITAPTTYGSQATGIAIAQTVKTKAAYAAPEEIRKTKEDVLEYLEYGDNTEKTYYTTKQYDTVAGVGAKNFGLSATQIMNINRDQISSTDQVLPEGMKLCVTYFESPVDIVVYRETFREETVFYNTTYSTDDTMEQGESEVRQEGQNGTRNALYAEKWVNGVLTNGTLESSVETSQPVDEVVAVGTKQEPGVGTGQFRYPVDNAAISCGWGCYFGHKGTDFINMYDSWGEVIAADSGVVETNSYNSVNGWYVRINHNNGYVSYYGHMRSQSDLPVGAIVEKGQVIGQIGMTGYATGPHVHFFLEYNGERHNACEVRDFPSCEGLYQ